MPMLRKPIVAGQFYENNFDKLNKQIENCFSSKFGPGDLPISKRTKRIFGIISPHAGYQFSGPCAAWAYKEIAESKFPDLFIIIGPNHSGTGSCFSTYLFSDWETPFGIIKVDKEFGKQLIKKFPDLHNESLAHLYEHSIEVQLPFLQFVNKDNLKNIKFLPIVMDICDFKLCNQLGKAIADTDKEICIIASSDFTHYGSNYNYIPFFQNKKENIYKLDNGALEFIKKMDTEGFLNYKIKEGATICGASAIATAIESVKSLGSTRARVLRYYTSSDIAGDYDNAVGYASVVFE